MTGSDRNRLRHPETRQFYASASYYGFYYRFYNGLSIKEAIEKRKQRERERERERERGIRTGTVSLVAVVSHSAVLVSITYELLDDTPPVVALEVPGVLAVRRCDNTTSPRPYIYKLLTAACNVRRSLGLRHVFSARRYASAVYVVVVLCRLSVCPSVRHNSQVGVLLKWLNAGSCKLRHTN